MKDHPKITYIETKEDGRAKVEWWEQNQFLNRTNKIYSGDTFDSMKLQSVIPIPDNVVLCDFCNFSIKEFPVPVVWNHALCKKCFNNIQIHT